MFSKTIVTLCLFAVGVLNVAATPHHSPSPTLYTSTAQPSASGMPVAFRKDRVRLAFYLTRRDNYTHEEWSEYWANTHSKIFTSIPIVQKNLLRYEQAHVNETTTAAFQALGFPIATYDGVAIFEPPASTSFWSDDYKNIAIPNESIFVDRPKGLALPFDIIEFIDRDSD
ncbi:hypothetical protein BD779DRAFT_1667065 [Infundibulicybe gibba]|nr:hypothetical protein BD779DRAFT_1667065 [Infundibulicybe gibba]